MSTDLAPRHLQLRDFLFRRWKTNGVKVGDRIESQNEITKLCGFSLITVTKTLKDLEAEGIIRRQVGKGSYLLHAPWAAQHHRVGLFYNRDVVGGGIFNNSFYTKLVIAFEQMVVSEGHEFILGSFTNDKMPEAIWDALDVIVLTSVTADTDLAFLSRATSQISVIDATLVHDRVHSYRIDYAQAFRQMVAHLNDRPRRYLYIDSVIPSIEQPVRRDAAEKAVTDVAGNSFAAVRANQETGQFDAAGFERAIAEYRPDIAFGHSHGAWAPIIEKHLAPNGSFYSFALDSDGPGFVVHTKDWMQSVLPSIYANLDNRRAKGAVHQFSATFQP